MPPLTDRRELSDALRGAIERDELFAEYQPQADLLTGGVVAAESLVRWRHPRFGLVPPANFIPLAEDSGVIHEIGRFMLDEGVRCAADWAARGIPLSISVNVSPVQLRDDALVTHLADSLASSKLAGGSMTLEITESLPLEDLPAVITRLESLRALGLGISIDDVGAGFATLELVEQLPATEVKLDLSLLQDGTSDAYDVMAAVVANAVPRGISVVAEGVETIGQLYRARDLGCARGQGYLIGRPMSCDDLERLLAV